MAAVGEGGRVDSVPIMRCLGWSPGILLDIRQGDQGTLLVTARPDGTVVVTQQGYFRLPYRVRRRISLFLGDRVLLAAYPTRYRLAVVPPSALEIVISGDPSIRT